MQAVMNKICNKISWFCQPRELKAEELNKKHVYYIPVLGLAQAQVIQ